MLLFQVVFIYCLNQIINMFSEKKNLLRFQLKQRNGKDESSVEMTVYDYFVNHRRIPLKISGSLPCINIGKPKRPTFIPVEVTNVP